MVNDLDRERSEVRHAKAGMACAIKCVRNFVFLLDEKSTGITDEQWDVMLKEAMRDAAELLHVVDGTAPGGELPPIPPLEVPPIPDGPAVGMDF